MENKHPKANCGECTLKDETYVPSYKPPGAKLAYDLETFIVTSKDIERFLAKVEVVFRHWIWIGGLSKQAYGKFWINGRTIPAHRFSYFLVNGPLDRAKEIDHLCKIHPCVHPCCLEEVTPQINQHRSESVSGLNHAKTRCRRGHLFTPDNMYCMRNGERRCKSCDQWNRAVRNFKKASLSELQRVYSKE